MQTMVDSLTKYISEHTEFTQDIFVAILGVVVGSILTALINTHATRAQAKFSMEHELLKEYHKKVQQFCRDIEEIEISLAQLKWETAELSGKIYAVDTALVQFIVRLQDERKFVRKHLSAKSVHKFIDGVTLFHSSLFVPAIDTNSGLPSFELLEKIDTEHVGIMRCAEKEMQKISVCFSDSMEHILSPGIFGWLKRKVRKLVMAISECIAIATDNNKQQSKSKQGK